MTCREGGAERFPRLAAAICYKRGRIGRDSFADRIGFGSQLSYDHAARHDPDDGLQL